MTEPRETPAPDVLLYHANCMDGLGAALACWLRFGDRTRYIPVRYQQPHPVLDLGAHVVIVDFSYPRELLLNLATVAGSLVVLDHHKTAAEELVGLPKACRSWDSHRAEADLNWSGQPRLGVTFDMARSGCMLAWEFFHMHQPTEKLPAMLWHVGMRDLWNFVHKDTRAITAWVDAQPADFPTWAALLPVVQNSTATVAELGRVILQARDKMVREAVATSRRWMTIGGVYVQVANVPLKMASEAAGLLAEGVPFAATYCDLPDGRHVSLRSDKEGMDVSAVAQAYGGGGHARAAGFRVPHGWGGDTPGA